MSLMFQSEHVADPPTRDLTCQVFLWIGQRFDTCDGCGRPLREHMFHPTYGGQRPVVYVRQHAYADKWIWRPAVPRQRSQP